MEVKEESGAGCGFGLGRDRCEGKGWVELSGGSTIAMVGVELTGVIRVGIADAAGNIGAVTVTGTVGTVDGAGTVGDRLTVTELVAMELTFVTVGGVGAGGGELTVFVSVVVKSTGVIGLADIVGFTGGMGVVAMM